MLREVTRLLAGESARSVRYKKHGNARVRQRPARRDSSQRLQARPLHRRRARQRRFGLKIAQRSQHMSAPATPDTRSILATEERTYFEQKPRLLSEAPGQYVLIVDDKVIGTFAEYGEAVDAAYARFGIRPIFVRQIAEDEPVHECWSTFE